MHAFASPDSYGLVLLLILATYVLSAALSASWAASLVIAVQIVTVWVALRASRARRSARVLTSCALAASALAAVANLFFRDQIDGGTVASWVSCLLYLIAPMSIIRHLIMRRVVDGETLIGAIDAYLMAGMFFAFLYHSVSLTQQVPPFFGDQGHGTFPQDLFFSFTTLTTTGYGNLVPAANPGQTFATLEMVTGQLFLVTAVGKVVSSWRPGQSRKRPWDSSSHELGLLSRTGIGIRSARRSPGLPAPAKRCDRVWHPDQPGQVGQPDSRAGGCDPAFGLFTRQNGHGRAGHSGQAAGSRISPGAPAPGEFHDLRDGAASLAKAAGLGRSTLALCSGTHGPRTPVDVGPARPDVARAPAERLTRASAVGCRPRRSRWCHCHQDFGG